MSSVEAGQLSPQLVLDEMKKNGVTHVVWLPDSETNFLYQLMQAEPSLRLVPVSREGLAFSIAGGPAHRGRAGAGQLLPLHARQRVVRDHGGAAGPQCQDGSPR